ncbi:hypothetical protein Acr_04g0002040 [Actinidia rufa]|uniref:Uncharacterized protein n=1 Tax=Actinidia rufa TaxID=165716 RepID=A0A7J0EH12_9ERIC|nr:hypothetical protein Acr_04g0002040 [Actinidia rufa]
MREVVRCHLLELVGLVEHAGLIRIMVRKMMGGGASAPGGNMGGAPPTILGGAEFMQGMFTAIEQVVRNTVQTMQVLVRTTENRVTTAMKAFLQLHPPMFEGEPDLSVVAIEETLNKTRTIQNPKSQRERTNNQSEGCSSKKPRNSTTQQQYPMRTLPTTSVVSYGQTSQGGPIYFGYHQSGHHVVDCPLKVHVEGEQLGGYGIATTYSISSGLEGHSSIYISIDFILVQTTGYSSAGSEDTRMGLHITSVAGSSGTTGQ